MPKPVGCWPRHKRTAPVFFVSEETFAGLLLVCSRWGRSRWLTQWDRRALHFQNPIQSPEQQVEGSVRKEAGICRQPIRSTACSALCAKREARKKREQQRSQHNKTNLKQQRRVAEPIQASGNTRNHRGASSQLAALTLMSTPAPVEPPATQINRGTPASRPEKANKRRTHF